MALTLIDKNILAALDMRGGFTTGQVAKKIHPQFGHNARTHSGAVRSWLIRLEKERLVGRLDDQIPVCWIKTATGSLVK